MNNWKCLCGVVNFASEPNCKRCGVMRQGVQPPTLTEHAAPDGSGASTALRVLGILVMGFSVIIGALMFVGQSANPLSGFMGVCLLFYGVTTCCLFVGFSVIIDNLVALRKNSQHLAAIRVNTQQQQHHQQWQ